MTLVYFRGDFLQTVVSIDFQTVKYIRVGLYVNSPDVI